MSKDIRSFFRPQKAQKSKLEDHNDVLPESPDVQMQMKKREIRKKRILSDSDEEIFLTKKKKSSEDTKKSSQITSKHKYHIKKELKEVKALDIFGTAPIKRSEPIIKKETETGIHSDDDFDRSLLELDATEEIDINNIKKDISPNKSNNHKEEKKSSLDKNTLQGLDKSILKSSSKDLEVTFEKDLNKAKKRRFDELSSDEIKPIQHIKTSKSKDTRKKLNESTDANTVSINYRKPVPEFADSVSMELETSEIKNKKNLDTSFNESVLTDEEKFERKRHSAALYQKYLNRSGPKHLGSKEIPEGATNCLKDCVFLLTGVLDSFEREEVAEAITKFSGTIKNSISKKVTHVLAGDEPGPAKIAKAQEFGIKILNENEFLELIQNKSKKQKSGQLKMKEEKNYQKKPNHKFNKDTNITINQQINNISSNTNTKECLEDKGDSSDRHAKTEKVRHNYNQSKSLQKAANENNTIITSESSVKACTSANKDDQDLNSYCSKNLATNSQQCIMWVEKYKPQTLKQIIGQHGEASNVKKLCNWLTKWYANRKTKLPKPSPWVKNDDGGYYKAALLSGPPGVGKTTTVSLVCKELGFDMVEFNASDTRSKALIKEQIGELLTTTSLSGYAKGKTGKQAVTKKHVLVMDEVDGMAGNEDRGGLQELIGLIKAASVPIICMCNDRNSQKMRSLVNYCYELRFSRPRVDQIKAAMMSICCKEGIKVGGEALARLIAAANQDVRQTLNLLSVWAPNPAALRHDTDHAKKDLKLGPWEAIRKVFSAEEHKTMNIHDKSDLFFYDYSLAPLFVQENYLQVAPHCPKHEVLERLSRAADSISAGDLVEARIRGNQAWNLLPIQAMYSSVIPGHAMSGHITGQIQFPGWLGKNSRSSKMHRLCQDIHAHTRLSTSGSKSSIYLDYCTHLRDAIVTPLMKDKSDGIAQSLHVLESYHLLREDLDSLTEMSLWPGQRNPMILIDSKVKAAMTRTYNKKASALPYAPGPVRRARAAADDADAADSAEVLSSGEDQDSDLETDALIKKRKVKESEKTNAGNDAPGTSKYRPASSKGKSKKK